MLKREIDIQAEDNEIKMKEPFLTPQLKPKFGNDNVKLQASPFSIGCMSPKRENPGSLSPRPHSLSVNYGAIQHTIKKLKHE